MAKAINEAKVCRCECRCEFDGRKFNSKQKCNDDKCQFEYKKPIKHRVYEEDYS